MGNAIAVVDGETFRERKEEVKTAAGKHSVTPSPIISLC
jgi:hypothetical protein